MGYVITHNGKFTHGGICSMSCIIMNIFPLGITSSLYWENLVPQLSTDLRLWQPD